MHARGAILAQGLAGLSQMALRGVEGLPSVLCPALPSLDSHGSSSGPLSTLVDPCRLSLLTSVDPCRPFVDFCRPLATLFVGHVYSFRLFLSIHPCRPLSTPVVDPC